MNQKGFTNIILIVVIVILLGVVGYFVFIKKSEPIIQQPTPTSTQTTTTPKTPASPIPINRTANLKTYTNIKYGFKFKYPNNLKAITLFYSSQNINVCDTDDKPDFRQNCYFGLDYYNNLYDLTGSQADKLGNQVLTISEYVDARGWLGITKASLSQGSGYCGTYQLPNESTVRSCIFEHNGYFFQIPTPDTKVGNQILSTFKFTQ